MATSTTNINLTKPATTENWNVENHFNANMQKIDDFAGLFMIDFGSKSVSAFHDALSTTMGGVANGQSVSFTVNFTDSVSPMSSGAHTGVATRSSSTRVNVILQRSGSSTNDSYLGSLTSNGWSWDKVATNSQLTPSTYAQATRQSTYLSGGSCRYVQVGKIVLVIVAECVISTDIPSQSASYATALFTGLPKAASTGINYMLHQYSSNAAVRISLVNGSNDAAISVHYNGRTASAQQLYGTFWYIAA